MKEFVDDMLDELNAALRLRYAVSQGQAAPTTSEGTEYITYAATVCVAGLNARDKTPQECVQEFLNWWTPQLKAEFPDASELILRTPPSLKVEYIARDDLCGNITVDTSAPYLRVRVRCAFK